VGLAAASHPDGGVGQAGGVPPEPGLAADFDQPLELGAAALLLLGRAAGLRTAFSSSCGRTPSFLAAARRRRWYSASVSAASFWIALPAMVALLVSSFAFGRRTGRPSALIWVMCAFRGAAGGR
jgi:hypothetical protein